MSINNKYGNTLHSDLDFQFLSEYCHWIENDTLKICPRYFNDYNDHGKQSCVFLDFYLIKQMLPTSNILQNFLFD